MNSYVLKISSRGQTAMEYLLILTVVAILTLISFNTLIPAIRDSQDNVKNPRGFFTKVDRVILGEHPNPINGGWCPVECPAPGSCGDQYRYRVCECPAPAFGGKFCQADALGLDQVTCPGVTACGSAGAPASCLVWEPWGACSSSDCGTPGTQLRFCQQCAPEGCPAPQSQNCYGDQCPTGQACKNNSCVNNPCTGTIPAHSTSCPICSGTVTTNCNIAPEDTVTPYTLSDSCNPESSCQTTCALISGKQYVSLNGQCVYCVGFQPANTTLCPNSPVPNGTTDRFNLASDCNSPKACQVVCQNGSALVGSSCLKDCICNTSKCTNNSKTITCTPNPNISPAPSCPAPYTMPC